MEDCIGQLHSSDPLYNFFVGDELRLGQANAVFDVYPLDEFRTIFRYALRGTETNVVGKFYGHKWLYGSQNGHRELRSVFMRNEFANLRRVQDLGLESDSYRAVRPLAVNEACDCVLVEEFAPGPGLDSFVSDAAHGGGDQLRHGLDLAASFLADLHDRSEKPDVFRRADAVRYLSILIEDLAPWPIVPAQEFARLEELRDRWNRADVVESVPLVLTHGDATPQHFRFDGQRGLTVIDWESLRPGDRAADVGLLAGELKHAFYCRTGDIWASEPYIQHLYRAYSARAAHGCGRFADFTTRGRFYMGCCLLRICRNPWMDLEYRRSLIPEALGCLEI